MRLVLIGDVHIYRLWVPPWRLVGKALIGQGNLWLKRRLHFRRRLLPHVLDRAADLAPDLLLFSGDLTTTAKTAEFREVARQVAARRRGIPGVLVPGNHDRYTFTSRRTRRIERRFPTLMPPSLPYDRPLDDRWHLLALDASVPRAITSRGRLGAPQIERARRFLARRDEGDGVVVLCHYPFATPPHLPRMRWHHRLSDRDDLEHVLSRCPPRVLFLHGHVHQPWIWRPEHLPRVTVLNAGAPCLASPAYPGGQGFWEVELPPDPAAPPTFVHHRMERLPDHRGRGVRWLREPSPP